MSDYPVTIILLIANIVFSLVGFSQPGLFERFKFNVGAVMGRHEYYRLVTSAFLHVGIGHLAMNMLTLYFMGNVLEQLYNYRFGALGTVIFLSVYFGSMLGGDFLAIIMKRNNPHYSAVGASGAVMGLVFALLILAPYEYIYIYFALPIPFWLFGILYMAYSIFGVRTGHSNLGHEAHIGGALVGLLIGSIFFPQQLMEHWILISGITIPTVILLYLIYHNPDLPLNPLKIFGNLNWGFGKQHQNPFTNSSSRSSNTPQQQDRVKQDGLEINMRAQLQSELDHLLDKVSRHGEGSLSMVEKRRLAELSAYLNRNKGEGGRAPSE